MVHNIKCIKMFIYVKQTKTKQVYNKKWYITNDGVDDSQKLTYRNR